MPIRRGLLVLVKRVKLLLTHAEELRHLGNALLLGVGILAVRLREGNQILRQARVVRIQRGVDNMLRVLLRQSGGLREVRKKFCFRLGSFMVGGQERRDCAKVGGPLRSGIGWPVMRRAVSTTCLTEKPVPVPRLTWIGVQPCCRRTSTASRASSAPC